MILVGAGFCLSALKDNHHAIFFAPLSFLRRYLVVVPFFLTLILNSVSANRFVLEKDFSSPLLAKRSGEGLGGEGKCVTSITQ